jgi:hypothetical protein
LFKHFQDLASKVTKLRSAASFQEEHVQIRRLLLQHIPMKLK